MARGRTRHLMVMAITTGALVGVSACGSGDVAEVGDVSESARSAAPSTAAPDAASPSAPTAPRARPDVAGTTSLAVQAPWTTVDENGDHRLLAPGVDLRVARTALLDEIPRDVAEDVGALDVRGEGDVVQPAEGQRFLVATYTSTDPRWEPTDAEPPSAKATFVLGGDEVGRAFDTSEGTKQRGTAVVSVPADPEPRDAVIRVESDGQEQSISLVDGSRVATDVPHVYDLEGKRVKLERAETVQHHFTGWTDERERIGGKVLDAFVTPYLDRDHGGHGWADRGTTYLSVALRWQMTGGGGAFDRTRIHAELPDGTTIPLSNAPDSLTNRFKDRAVFEVPTKVTTVRLVITPRVEVGGGGKNVTKWKPATSVLRII